MATEQIETRTMEAADRSMARLAEILKLEGLPVHDFMDEHTDPEGYRFPAGLSLYNDGMDFDKLERAVEIAMEQGYNVEEAGYHRRYARGNDGKVKASPRWWHLHFWLES